MIKSVFTYYWVGIAGLSLLNLIILKKQNKDLQNLLDTSIRIGEEYNKMVTRLIMGKPLTEETEEP